MKEELLQVIQNKNYRPVDTFGLVKKMSSFSGYTFSNLTKAIYELESTGMIAKNKKNQYDLVERMGMLRGKIDVKAAGYGFLISETDEEDVFIPAGKMENALSDDYCLVKVMSSSRGHRKEGRVVKVLKRHYDVIIGHYHQGAIFLKQQKDNILFRVRKNQKITVHDHQLVKAKVISFHQSGVFECDILEVLGEMDNPFIDIIEVIHEHHLQTTFPEDVLEEVKSIPVNIDLEDKKDRVDLTDKLIFTIDGDDTKDIDDAISIEKIDHNLYLLGVHIADVSYYVKKGSALDQEALQRGTSVYLVNQVIPMLPRELSNGICSLNPSVDRFAISCMMKINTSGEVIHYEFFPSIIHSRYQMTYHKVNLILNHDSEMTNQYQDLVNTIFDMNELAQILNKVRTRMGSINFETIEPKVLFTEEGYVKDIIVKERGISEGIIEEFMLVANQVVATHFDRNQLPFIYRIHEQPDPEKLNRLFTLARELGYTAQIPNPVTHMDLQKLLNQVSGTKYEKVMNTMMLRSMAKAKYSEECLGHYGLAFDEYTHFTSPIRRYPDLIVHRYIRDYLFLHRYDQKSIQIKSEELPEIAKQASLMERNAIECEREVMDIKKAEYMEKYVGDEFEGLISTLTRFGMFVELPNTIEGLVHISSMNEAIEFNEEKMIYLGISSRIEYTIGTIVKVKCVSVSKSLGRIDFELI